MSWLDGLADMAGLKALQAGADLRIAQRANLNLAIIPREFRDAAAAHIAQRFRDGTLTPEDDFSAAVLKLGYCYACADAAGALDLKHIIYRGIEEIMSVAGHAVLPAANLELIAWVGSGPARMEPPPLPSTGQPPELGDSFDQEHERLFTGYNDGTLTDEEYWAGIRDLLRAEANALIDRRLREHIGTP